MRRRSFGEPGHAHELTFSCYRGYPFLKAECTSLWLAESIEEARRSLDIDLWAYVFMPEHAHLIVRPRGLGCPTSAILKAIKAPVARRAIAQVERDSPDWLPRLTRSRGGRSERLFWQAGGGYDRDIVEPRTLRLMMDYIHQNPARRGLVDRPADWAWSSAGWYAEAKPGLLRPDPIPPEWGG